MGRILVVDDEDAIRHSLQRRLEREGHTVHTASAAAAGMEKIQSGEASYDLVITDMSMEEGESGMQMLCAALERDPDIQVIVLTAYGNVRNAVECMQKGASDYVEKNIPDVDVFELLVIKAERALIQRSCRLQARNAA